MASVLYQAAKNTTSMNKPFFIMIAISGGLLVAAQAGINARLRAAVGDPMLTVFISFLIGTAVAGVLLIIRTQSFQGMPAPSEWLSRLPWWALLGGACGVGYIMSTVIGVPKIGAALCIASIVFGQQVGAILIDHYGWLGVTPTPINGQRMLALAFMCAGLWVMYLG